MLIPRKNSFDYLDDFFDDAFSRKECSLMKTDIREKKDKYIIDIDLPGFSKEDISLSLDNGYLEVSAKSNYEESDDEKYIRKERVYKECSRSFYVGDEVKEEDISASHKNGTLVIEILKKDEEDKLPSVKQIEIK